jgi:hypothetical protein
LVLTTQNPGGRHWTNHYPPRVPVLQVSALDQPGVDVEQVLAALCREVAEELGEDPRGTWATWQAVDAYAEGDDVRMEQPRDTHPPIVRVIGFEGKPAEVVQRILERVANVLERELRLEPGTVFAIYDEARSGRLLTGGRVV